MRACVCLCVCVCVCVCVCDRELTVLLELASGHLTTAVTDSVLHKALEDVQMTWVTKQVSGQDYLQRMPLTDAEVRGRVGWGRS